MIGLAAAARPLRYGFTWGIVAALSANLALYNTYGRLSEIVDSLAWLVLLILFILEAQHGGRLTCAQRLALRLGRLPAGALVLWAVLAYMLEAEWLDAANAWLWLAVVALIEAQLRWPDALAPHRRAVATLSALLYAGLFAFVLAWLLQGEWLDAWDATLWLAAFFLIELDLSRRPQPAHLPSRNPSDRRPS